LGLIEKQTIKGTIYTYIGVVLGVITNIFLLAWFFTPEQVGLLSVIISYALLFSQLGNLGFDNVTGRLFPWFRTSDKSHHGYLHIMLLVGIAGSLLIIISFFFLKNLIISQGGDSSGLLAEYWFYIPSTAVFLLFFNLFDAYSRMMYLTIRGTFLKEFFQRLLIIISIGLYIFSLIGIDSFVGLYFASFCIPTVIIIFMLLREKNLVVKPEPEFISKDLRKSMISVAGFGILTVFSSTIILNIDRIMIEKFIGLYEAGIYSVTFFFGVVILLPSRSLVRISSTFLSEAWKDNNMNIIKDIYYKSSLNQYLFSALLFAGIWVNIDNVFYILPEKYEPGRWVVFWICLSSLIDMATGLNSAIIGTSKYYRLYAYFMIFFVAVIIVSNYLLIPIYGITGAALASAIAMFLFNLVRWVFLWYKFKLQPFNLQFLYISVITIAAYFAGYLIPVIEPFWIDIIIRSTVVFLVFTIPVLGFRLSEDVSKKVSSIISSFRK
jgi:O-antigen/teichoic acid export membrane protein